MTNLSHQDVVDAASRIQNWVHRTPVFTSRRTNERTGAEVFFKAEVLQRTGSFKFRGATNAMLQLSASARAGGVLTFSSGNHAQALALAGREHGVSVVVVMPSDAPEIKRRATEGYGAEVVLYERNEESREALGAELAATRGLTVIPPYDHEHIIAGQGTACLELLSDHPEIEVILAPVGGGGLLAGTALAAGGRTVIGVEPAGADDAAQTFRSGSIVTLSSPSSVADGALTPYIGVRNWAVIQELVSDIVTVTEEEILAAMLWLWEAPKICAEPTGAMSTAGLFAGAFEGKKVGVIVSGGNFDPKAISKLLR